MRLKCIFSAVCIICLSVDSRRAAVWHFLPLGTEMSFFVLSSCDQIDHCLVIHIFWYSAFFQHHLFVLGHLILRHAYKLIELKLISLLTRSAHVYPRTFRLSPPDQT